MRKSKRFPNGKVALMDLIIEFSWAGNETSDSTGKEISLTRRICGRVVEIVDKPNCEFLFEDEKGNHIVGFSEFLKPVTKIGSTTIWTHEHIDVFANGDVTLGEMHAAREKATYL